MWFKKKRVKVNANVEREYFDSDGFLVKVEISKIEDNKFNILTTYENEDLSKLLGLYLNKRQELIELIKETSQVTYNKYKDQYEFENKEEDRNE